MDDEFNGPRCPVCRWYLSNTGRCEICWGGRKYQYGRKRGRAIKNARRMRLMWRMRREKWVM